MILNLKEKQDELPPHLRDALVGLQKDSLSALRTYTEYMGIEPRSVSYILFDEGWGAVDEKCAWASEIAEMFTCIVEFSHAEIPTICFPTTAQAALTLWNERSKQGEK